MAHYALIYDIVTDKQLLGAVIDDGISSYTMAFGSDFKSMLDDAIEDIDGDEPRGRLRAILHGMSYYRLVGPTKRKGSIPQTALYLESKYGLPA